MKIKVVNNRHFKLTVEDTEFVLNQYIRPNYSYHDFMVKKSEKTNSIYIYVFYDNKRYTIRLSDHPHEFLRYNHITPSTKIHKVVAIFVHEIKLMHDKYLRDVLSLI